MPYAWTGVNLEVDLSQGKIEKVKGDPKLIEQYLGGKGPNAQIYWDRVLPEVDPFSPDNLMIIGTGLLCATPVPGANHTTITFKSPLTGLYSFSCGGGFFAPELKRAGYDTVIISGKSPTPVYLWIDDDRVEICDASHLWGQDTHETQRLIREELKQDVQVIAIGPAGENRVMAASIEHSIGVSFSRGAIGAFMGDKKLKAIAVHGTRDVSIANPAKLVELCEGILSRTEPMRAKFVDFGPRASAFATYGGFHNWGDPITEEFWQKIVNFPKALADYCSKHRVREVACHNCTFRCKHVYPRPDGGYSFIKCGSWGMPAISTKIVDAEFAIQCYYLCEKYGFDSFAINNYIAFAIDLYKRGILTKADTDGMELDWEKPEVALKLIEMVALRQGIGDVLANGLYRAARQIGNGAEERVVHIKKQEPIPWEMRGCRGALVLSITPTHDTMKLISPLTPIWSKNREAREAYVKEGLWHYPEGFDKMFIEHDFDYTDRDYDVRLPFMTFEEELYNLCDLLGICYFWVGRGGPPPINSRALMAELVSAAAGLDVDEAEVIKATRRAITLDRAIQVREGVRRRDDTIPEWLFQRRPFRSFKNFGREIFNIWLDRYYEVRGWDKDGIPTKETLEELGLDFVKQELGKSKILTG